MNSEVRGVEEVKPPHMRKADIEQLMVFYGAASIEQLVAAQAYHIEKLQSRLPPSPNMAPRVVREG